MKLVVLSDLHIGNSHVPAQALHQNLKDYFYPQLIDCDILLIAGDFFHTLLSLDSIAGIEAISVINELIQMSMKHDFLIRLVQGTFSHDRNSLRIFLTQRTDIPDRVKLFESVSVEYIAKLDIKILYLVDDLPDNSIPDIKQHLKDTQTKEVDFILGHGMYTHVLPHNMPHKPPNTYNYKTFANLVKGLILFGHIHTKSVYKNIIYGGSFDRTAHGEEESKGFFTILYEAGVCTHKFHKNEGASIFTTVDLTAFEPHQNEVFKVAESRLKHIVGGYTGPSSVNIRLILVDRLLAQILKNHLKSIYKNIRITTIRPKDMVEYTSEDIKLELSDLPNITKDNLSALVYNHLQQEGSDLKLTDIQRIIGR